MNQTITGATYQSTSPVSVEQPYLQGTGLMDSTMKITTRIILLWSFVIAFIITVIVILFILFGKK